MAAPGTRAKIPQIKNTMVGVRRMVENQRDREVKRKWPRRWKRFESHSAACAPGKPTIEKMAGRGSKEDRKGHRTHKGQNHLQNHSATPPNRL